MFLSKVVSRSGKREDVIEFMQVAGFAYGIAIVFSFRIESSKCPLKKMFIGSKKPLAHICDDSRLFKKHLQVDQAEKGEANDMEDGTLTANGSLFRSTS